MIGAQAVNNQVTFANNGGQKQPIILVATVTVDRTATPDGILEVAGGPPNFAGPALNNLGWSYRLLTGQTAIVDVISRDGEEEVVIPALPAIPLPVSLEAPAIILSPIMREIDIYALPDLDGLIVADLQGFVRHPGIPSGRPDRDVDLRPLLQRVHVVKATRTELEALSEPSRRMLQDIMLVVTRGHAGAQIITRNDSVTIPAHPVSGVNTIGAGDTFLAAFTAHLLAGADPAEAGNAAARFTEAFLCKRRSG